MEKLMELARGKCDQVEIFFSDSENNSVSMENGKLHDIASKFSSGLNIRVIKDGKIGFAYTRNLIDREEILQNAMNSLIGEVPAVFDFPLTKEIPQLSLVDENYGKITNTQMVRECERIRDLLKNQVNAELSIRATKYSSTTRIMNSAGTDISYRNTGYFSNASLIYPGGASGLSRYVSGKGFTDYNDEIITELISMYKQTEESVHPQSGHMKVLFMPGSQYTLLWRVWMAASAQSLYDGVSSLKGKTGEKVFSDILTIYDDPLNDSKPGAVPIDDEGIIKTKFNIIENGVFRNFYNSLKYAAKTGQKPTGHGSRGINSQPIPELSHLTIKHGVSTFAEMVASMDRGIILEHVLGAHSGNIANGDYSVGVCPAFYVENGQIIGRVKDTMIAGNIYDTLKNVIAVENADHIGTDAPSILCDNVSVAIK